MPADIATTPVSTARTDALALVDRPWRNLIGGRWEDAASGGAIDIYDPSEGAVIAQAPAGASADIDAAVGAARASFERRAWLSLAPEERAARLWRVGDLIERDADRLMALARLNNGVATAIAERGVSMAARLFRYYAGWCDKIGGTTSDFGPQDAAFHGQAIREPLGVMALVIPWNGPLGSAAMKLAPALAAGCSCIVKPAEEAPLAVYALGELLIEAGIPEGVVNVVNGRGVEAGAALASHPDVDGIHFTGSTSVGKSIAAAAATSNLKRVHLELGGKSPVLIFDDADLGKAVPGAAMGVFHNSGQVCMAGSRVYIQRSIFDRVVDEMIAFGRTVTVGGGFDPDTRIGPLISAKQLDRVTSMLTRAREAGCSVHDGKRLDRPGYFVEPAIVTGAGPDAEIVRDEVFGPVLTAIPFDSAEEALALANDSDYGLAGAVWTSNIARAQLVTRRLRAGTVWVNCQLVLHPTMPFGGYGQSGWGRENALEGLGAYLETKSIISSVAI